MEYVENYINAAWIHWGVHEESLLLSNILEQNYIIFRSFSCDLDVYISKSRSLHARRIAHVGIVFLHPIQLEMLFVCYYSRTRIAAVSHI